jgi:predicted NAD/FAD-binding protein
MEKLVVVGSGIAGMSAAYFLQERYDVTLLEKNDYIGGHTNTVVVDERGVPVSIDTGFMVFNEITYPNLVKLFDKLDVNYKNTDMSFAVKHLISGLEYNGSSMGGLFSQRMNIFNIKFWKMLKEINRFNKLGPSLLEDIKFNEMSVRDFIKEHKFSSVFLNNFLIPMSSAVWSTPFKQMLDFPVRSLIIFFKNHGFLGLDSQHQWKTVIGGSEQYKQKLLASLKGEYKVNSGVMSVYSKEDKKIVKLINGEEIICDKVVFAGHADETLSILKNPTQLQKDLLSKFKYQQNIAILHTDKTVMPKTKRAWSSWNYIIDNEELGQTFTVYYMNMLQNVSKNVDYFININGEKHVDPEKVIKRIIYHHPLFDVDAMKAQETLFQLNEQNDGLYFCGSYFKYGFHEDALTSSVDLCKSILDKEVL